MGAGAAGLGSSSSDDGSDEDGGMPTYGYGCIACHHAADGCIACRAVDDRCFGDDFGPTADVDYSDSGSEDAHVPAAFVDRTPAPRPPPAPAAPPLLPSPPETWTQKKRRKPTLPSHLRAKRRK